MAKFNGNVGFEQTIEKIPGVWSTEYVYKNYKGDVLRNAFRYENSQGVNDNHTLNIRISIVADGYCWNNLHKLRFVEYLGANWEVTAIDIERPRIILTIGGVYNGADEQQETGTP